MTGLPPAAAARVKRFGGSYLIRAAEYAEVRHLCKGWVHCQYYLGIGFSQQAEQEPVMVPHRG